MCSHDHQIHMYKTLQDFLKSLHYSLTSLSLSLSLSTLTPPPPPPTHPEASGGNLTTTLPISAPGSSTNLPTSACFAFGPCRYTYCHDGFTQSLHLMEPDHSHSGTLVLYARI